MSISNALSNALSGLSAAALRAEITSSNISNALTEGYGRREVQLSSTTLGQYGSGVSVDGVNRISNAHLVQDRREFESITFQNSTLEAFFSKLESTVGVPSQPGSLSGRIAKFETSLLEASSRPDESVRLQNVLHAANALTDHFNAISADIQESRSIAENAIATDVEILNARLAGVQNINTEIAARHAEGRDTAALLDQRQQLVDEISRIVPVKEIPRDNGAIALVSQKGAILLDGRPAVFGFSSVSTITPDMTKESAALSGLTFNGEQMDTTMAGSLFANGRLIANFAIRDEHSVEYQSQLDTVARNVIERFQSPTVDTTITATDAGLFTDGGSLFDPANTVGISARLNVNGLVDPAAGGEIWRIRDGLGAAVQGEVGDNDMILRMIGALTELQPPSPPSGGSGDQTLSGLIGGFVSNISTTYYSVEQENAYTRAQYEFYRAEELASGVDTDHEVQQLLQIETAYAANARVIQAADNMIAKILEI